MMDRVQVSDEMIDGYKVSAARKQLWIIELDLLKRLEETCKKYDINYFLLFGSAIGAVRHKGFIPWDDDIDLGMLREDFDKFLKADKSDWPSYIDIQYGISEHGADCLLRIRDGRTTGIICDEKNRMGNKGVFIEIYPFDYVNDNKLRTRQIKASQFLKGCMSCCYMPIEELSVKSKLKRVMVRCLGINHAWRLYEKVCKLQNTIETTYVDTITLPEYAATRHHLFYKEDVMESVYKEFEYTEVRIPIGYDRCLTTRYGNYMKLPPLEERGTHHSFEVYYDPYVSYTEYENSDIPTRYFSGDISLEKL